jgi:hypothetical protein
MIEGSGSVSLTNESVCGSGRPKNIGSYGYGPGSATLLISKNGDIYLIALLSSSDALIISDSIRHREFLHVFHIFKWRIKCPAFLQLNKSSVAISKP